MRAGARARGCCICLLLPNPLPSEHRKWAQHPVLGPLCVQEVGYQHGRTVFGIWTRGGVLEKMLQDRQGTSKMKAGDVSASGHSSLFPPVTRPPPCHPRQVPCSTPCSQQLLREAPTGERTKSKAAALGAVSQPLPPGPSPTLRRGWWSPWGSAQDSAGLPYSCPCSGSWGSSAS